jgi:hypothetical protein
LGISCWRICSLDHRGWFKNWPKVTIYIAYIEQGKVLTGNEKQVMLAPWANHRYMK